MSEKLIDLSIVIPCYNEEQSLQELYGRLCRVLQPITSAFELIFVDDGSTDRSLVVLQELRSKDERIKIIHFMYFVFTGHNFCRYNFFLFERTDIKVGTV